MWWIACGCGILCSENQNWVGRLLRSLGVPLHLPLALQFDIHGGRSTRGSDPHDRGTGVLGQGVSGQSFQALSLSLCAYQQLAAGVSMVSLLEATVVLVPLDPGQHRWSTSLRSALGSLPPLPSRCVLSWRFIEDSYVAGGLVDPEGYLINFTESEVAGTAEEGTSPIPEQGPAA